MPRRATRRPGRALVASLLTLALAAVSAGCSSTVEGPTVDGTDGLFDPGVVHTVTVTADPADVTAALATYLDTGEKVWVQAEVELDGTDLGEVGLRLKGNSSLRQVSVDTDPASLPWLVRLDKYVDGQSYGGVTSFVVRSSTTETALNESVALDLLAAAGLTSQQSASARFSVNGSAATLRLLVENPDETWEAATFDTPGLLYKAESGGDYSYRGEDPAAYDEIFDQETGEEDLTPLIDLLEFLDSADDATFAAELGEHLEVEDFARYLALEDLIGNFDDIDGPGNNSYLRWDATTERFTVVAWDHNLAFGAQPRMGTAEGGTLVPGDVPEGAVGPGAVGPGAVEPDAVGPDAAGPVDGVGPGGRVPPVVEGTAGVRPTAPPAGAESPSTGLAPGGTNRQLAGPGGMSGNNLLARRFLADEGFAALYDAALAEVTASLFDSGLLVRATEARAWVILEQAGDLVDADVVEQEVATITAFADE